MDKGEGKCEFPKLYSMFPDRALTPSHSQTVPAALWVCTLAGTLKWPQTWQMLCV